MNMLEVVKLLNQMIDRSRSARISCQIVRIKN